MGARWTVGAVAVLVGGGAVAGLLLWNGDRQGEARVPTESEVAMALDYAYRHASDTDLCEVAATQGMCQILLDQAPRPPAGAPELLCTVVYPGDENHVAGRLARIVGTSDSGAAYQTDILAISGAGGALLMNPVYWVSNSVGDSSESDDVIEVDCGPGAAKSSSGRGVQGETCQ